MRIYSIKTAYSGYTILSTSFDEAFGCAKKILEHEQKELYGSDEAPELLSIAAEDEIDEIPGAIKKKKGAKT